MNVRCSHCSTVYRIDPTRVPADGVSARCARCQNTFRIEPAPEPASVAYASSADRVPPPPPAGGQPSAPVVRPTAARPASAPLASAEIPAHAAPRVPVFGPQDPEARARRLARALVSDIVAYHRDRWEESLGRGTLREDFRDEILKSWEEYVLQVGSERAHGTSYFRDALNEILAKGRQVF